MAKFVKGDIVVVPFPFSGQANFKRRPAVVLASWNYGNSTDYLVAIVTSQNAPDPSIIGLEPDDVENGSLDRKSYIRPYYLFAVDEGLIVKKLGNLKQEKLEEVISLVTSLLS